MGAEVVCESESEKTDVNPICRNWEHESIEKKGKSNGKKES